MKRLGKASLWMAAACFIALAGSVSVSAEPVKTPKGRVQLQITGLAVDLEPVPGRTYHVSGSWSSSDDGETFNGKDIIDEIGDVSGSVEAGTWVLVGYFDAGDCDAVIGGESLDSAWEQNATIAGEAWKVRGGVFTFDGSLGRRPATLMCRTNAAGQSILLYRFLTNAPETTSQADMMKDAAAASSIAAASRAFSAGRVEDTQPMHRADVVQHGGTPAARQVTLGITGLSFKLPDDGYFWVANEDEENGVDTMTRLAPALPAVDLEILFAADSNCETIEDALTNSGATTDLRPLNLSSEWQPLSTLELDSGEAEYMLCHARNDGIVMVGVILPLGRRDMGQIDQLLSAIANADVKH